MLGVKTKTKPQAPPEITVEWRTEIGGHAISVAWSPDGKRLAAATADGPVLVLDGALGRPVQILTGHHGGAARLDWHPDGVLLATAGLDGRARLWNAANGEEAASLDAGAEWVEHAAWSPNGQYLATAAGRKLRLWDSQGQLLRDWPTQPSTIADIGWRPGANVLASCGYNGLRFWTPDKDAADREFPWKGSMLKLAWSPDGKYIATGNQDATIQFWIIATGKELQMWGYRSKIRELAWDFQSRYLASGGSATGVVWDCSGKGPAGTKPQMLEFHGALLSQLAYQNRGALLASGCNEGLLAFWQPGAKQLAPLATAHYGSAIAQIVWSPDDRRCAIGTAKGEVIAVKAPA